MGINVGVCPCWIGRNLRHCARSHLPLGPEPSERVLLLIAYPDIFECADRVPEIMSYKPIGLEGIDELLVEFSRRKGINAEGIALLPQGAAGSSPSSEPTRLQRPSLRPAN